MRRRYARPATRIALSANLWLAEQLHTLNPDGTHYIRAFRTKKGRELALDRTLSGIYLWTEPVASGAPPRLTAMLRRRYAPTDTRNSNLKANAPRLAVGNAADYWLFPTLDDLKRFISWYRSL